MKSPHLISSHLICCFLLVKAQHETVGLPHGILSSPRGEGRIRLFLMAASTHALQHPSLWRVLTNLHNPPENALLPLFYSEAADTQGDVAFLEGQSYAFRAHFANSCSNFEGLMHQTRSQMGTVMEMTKSSRTPVAPHQSSVAQTGKEPLSLGPHSAAIDCFHLLPMPASFTTCLPTSAVSKEGVEDGFRVNGNEWKAPGLLAIPKNINRSVV